MKNIRYLTLVVALLVSGCSKREDNKTNVQPNKVVGQQRVESGLIELTLSSYRKEVLESKIPVLVDIYMDKCQPCVVLENALKGLMGNYNGMVKFTKIRDPNPSSESSISKDVGVDFSLYPTLLFYKEGKVIHKEVGDDNVDKLDDLIRVKFGM